MQAVVTLLRWRRQPLAGAFYSVFQVSAGDFTRERWGCWQQLLWGGNICLHFCFVQKAGERWLSAEWGRGKTAGAGKVWGISLGLSKHRCPHGVRVLMQRPQSTLGFFNGFFTVYLGI